VIRLLFIGDIFGKTGRDLLRVGLAPLVADRAIDFIVANAENTAGGAGVTRETGEAVLACGVDLMTSGNHIWDKREALDYVATEPRILRPANYPAGAPGRGSAIGRTADGRKVGVVNVMGRVHMAPLDNPFDVVLREVERLRTETRVILVDMHAEATSEKIAMAWHLDGLVTLVVGTHTHVQTADERILPGGTACITDAGMTGPHDGVIGVEREPVLAKFRTGLPARFEPAGGDGRLHAVVVTADEATGRATAIERISLRMDELRAMASVAPDEKAAALRDQ
jgi:2',3'-cyclic-nucleotide 2'-phosphodiesterase